MPKLDNVTEADIKCEIDKSDDFLGAIHDFANRMEKGYCDNILRPNEIASNLSLLSSACSRLAMLVLAKAAMQEQKAELEALMKERAKLKD